jgi:hypothetical protein
MIILHNRQSAESRAFVASCAAAGHTIIDWYVDQAAVAGFLAEHPGLFPSAFPSVLIRRPDVEVPEATNPDTGETIPAHVEPAHWELVRCPSSLAELADLHDAYYGLTLAEAKALKQAEIRDAAEAALAPLRAEYGATEVATWDQQYSEAEAYAADPQAAVPLLSAIAAARGQTVADLASRVIANRAAWVAVTGHVVGQRLAAQDQLDAAQAVADVQAITVSYSLV